MPAPSQTSFPASAFSALGISALFPCFSGAFENRKPVGLLPCRRFAPAVLPVIGGATRAVERRNKISGGIGKKLFVERHGGSIAVKEKSAMPKIVLAKSRQCRQNSDTMKTLAQLETAWNSLPECTRFKMHFSTEVGEVQDAERDVAKVRMMLESALNRLDEEMEALNKSVSKAALKDWTAAEVKEAGL
jgi:hypothetical protein